VGKQYDEPKTEGRRPSAHQTAKPHTEVWQATLMQSARKSTLPAMKVRHFIVLSLLVTGGEFITRASPFAQEPNDSIEVRLSDAITDNEKLSDRDYLIRKHHRKVRIGDAIEGGRPSFADEEFAILSRHRRTLLRFDGLYAPISTTRFGLFSFLGRTRKQLFVSQDTFRGGIQWVVSLGRSPHVIYDGRAWLAGREVDDMSLVDLDSDGIYEISVPTCIFYGFASLSPGATPLPTIIFKYSRKAKRYLPANPRFADYLLSKIEERKQNIQPIGGPVNNMNHLGDVLGIVLDYIFAGRERAAWTFYDQAYKLPDKDKIKKEIRAELRDSPIYRFIYRKHARPRRT
jgi:hypothetical protein